MPSIAQQDYIVIKTSASSRPFGNDAAALSQIAGCISRGNIYDCLLQNYDGNEEYFTRIIAFAPADIIFYFDWTSGEIENMTIGYTVAQYQGLAAVQQALDAKYGLQEDIPTLTTSGATLYLQEDSAGRNICVDNKYLIVTGDETVTALTIAEIGPGEGDDFVNITWEDAQKLIGLPIA